MQESPKRIAALLGDAAVRALGTATAPRDGASERAILASYLFEPPEVLADETRHRSAGADGTADIEEHAGVEDEIEATADWVARQILDGTPRTSSLIECINGLLKSFLNNRQSFQDQETLQAYLDLFVLWHNMRPYQRGKRQGQSPYQIAGIDPGCTDWLELLGYPAN